MERGRGGEYNVRVLGHRHRRSLFDLVLIHITRGCERDRGQAMVVRYKSGDGFCWTAGYVAHQSYSGLALGLGEPIRKKCRSYLAVTLPLFCGEGGGGGVLTAICGVLGVDRWPKEWFGGTLENGSVPLVNVVRLFHLFLSRMLLTLPSFLLWSIPCTCSLIMILRSVAVLMSLP